MTNIQDIPTSVLAFIRPYLYDLHNSAEKCEIPFFDEFVEDQQSELNRESWRNFLSVDKSWISHERKELMDMRLSRFYSLKYLYDSTFRELVRSRVSSASKQLSLNFCRYFRSETIPGEYGEIMSNVYYLDLSLCQFNSLPEIHHVQELSLRGCTRLSTVKQLRKVNTVNLFSCTNLRDASNLSDAIGLNFQGCRQLTHDFSPFKEVKDLILPRRLRENELDNGCVKSICVYPTVQELPSQIDKTLAGNVLPNLTSIYAYNLDINEIKNTSHLIELLGVFPDTFRNLHGLENVFPSLTTLEFGSSFSEDYEIDFRSLFPRLKRVVMEGFSTLLTYDLRSIAHIPHIEFIYCPITSANLLANCISIDLSHSMSLVDVSALGRVKYLKLAYCSSLSDISGLGQGNIKLDLTACPLISEVSHLGKVKTLKLEDCLGISSVKGLGNVEFLSIRGCHSILDFSCLGESSQRFLNLAGCGHLETKNLFQFNNCYELIISHCHKITDISMLTKVRKLTAFNCEGLRMVELHGDFIRIDFHSSNRIESINIHGHVGILAYDGPAPVNVFGSLRVKVSSLRWPGYIAVNDDADNPDLEYSDDDDEDEDIDDD
jgi:hypothetical protein